MKQDLIAAVVNMVSSARDESVIASGPGVAKRHQPTQRDQPAPKSPSANLTASETDPSSLSLSESLASFHAQSELARQTRNGRELTLFEANPEKAGRMVDLLISGNYRETAATTAGITPQALRL